MSAANLADRHPRLFHMAEDGSLSSIQQHGLLSTTALLDLFEIVEPERSAIEHQWRPRSVEVSHPVHGTALIRDQKPMRPATLVRCLVGGLTPSDWYALINSKVFFWPTHDRVLTLLSALAYRDRTHLVLTLDTASLLGDTALSISVSRINSGSALYIPAERGLETFVPIDRPRLPFPIAEVAVEYSVTDVMRHVVAVERRQRDRVVERIL